MPGVHYAETFPAADWATWAYALATALVRFYRCLQYHKTQVLMKPYKADVSWSTFMGELLCLSSNSRFATMARGVRLTYRLGRSWACH
jgi:hypothetical protein